MRQPVAAEIRDQLIGATLPRLLELKAYWKVSVAALLVRAKTLKTLPENKIDYLWRKISALGYRTCEPIPLEVPSPRLIDELIEFHIETMGHSSESLAETLKLQLSEFESLYGAKCTKPKLLFIRS